MENVIQYLSDEALIVVPMLWFIGCLLKNTPLVTDWMIPWILTGCGILSAIILLGLSPSSVVQGVLVASTAVTGHQLLKQTLSKS